MIAARLAARLMRCAPLLDGLHAAVEHGDEDYFKPMAVAVIRRLLLTLKTMAWLEAAISRPWTHVRPQDLACFAFSATKPDWPRRVIAVSHRSADVKPTLIDMQLWHAGRCAIRRELRPVVGNEHGDVVESVRRNTRDRTGLVAAL